MPTGFTRCDEGRLAVRPDFLPRFQERGWTTLEALLRGDDATVMRTVAQRANCWVDVHAPNATGESVRLYLKRHDSFEPISWLVAKLTGADWLAPGIAEAEAAELCRAKDVPAMELVAVGCRRGRWPWAAESVFVSQAVPGEPADDLWGRLGPGDDAERREVLLALADTARRLHRAGLYHRDFYWCHFFPERRTEPDHGEPRYLVRLIDLQRLVRLPTWNIVGRLRFQLKDLAQFVFSMPADLTKDERASWWCHYVGTGRPTWLQRLAWQAVRVRAWFYERKERRRCASPS